MRQICLTLALTAVSLAGCGDEAAKSSANPERGRSEASDTRSDERPKGETTSPEGSETLPKLEGEEVQVNKIYRNGETLKMSIYGVSFKLPANVACAIGDDATAMQLAATDRQSLGLVFLKRDVDREAALQILKSPQEIEGVVLRPEGEPVEKDGVWFATHADANYEGHSALIIGPEHNGVLFFLGGMKSDSRRFKQVIDALAAGTKLGAPLESKSEQQWKQLLAGHMLTYMSSSYSGDGTGGYTGHSSKTEIRLFADGSFTWNSSDQFSVDTGGGSGAGGTGKGSDKGVWRIEPMGSVHMLTLKSSRDGSTREYRLGYRENKIYLNGTRYFRTAIE